MTKMNYKLAVEDKELEGMTEAQQDRRRAEDQEKQDIVLNREARAFARFEKHVHCVLRKWSRVSLFLAGACMTLAVHFFMLHQNVPALLCIWCTVECLRASAFLRSRRSAEFEKALVSVLHKGGMYK